jgi:fibro-slime domain-containing protein
MKRPFWFKSRIPVLGLAYAGVLCACSGSDEPTRRDLDHAGDGQGDGNGDGDGRHDGDGSSGSLNGDGDAQEEDAAPRPDCSSGDCTSECGDGLVFDEACDDGNQRDGDGCSHTCQVEEGFTCVTGGDCDELDGPCTLRVPVIYRDFRADHPDFEVGCGSLSKGVVEERLNADGKPVLKNGGAACIESQASFAEWYTNGARNVAIMGEIELYRSATRSGTYVNRYGARGEPWKDAQGQREFDGNPLFFPIDGAPDAFADGRFPAKIPEQYGYPGWPWESSLDASAKNHNFSFTTEVVYWFRYEAATPAQLEFSGDDDVWVFVNGTLAVDLGGVHVPETGSVTLDPANAQKFGLENGKVYEIRVFHAERKMEGSSFKLTLTGFNMQRSECRPVCGDGEVQQGEDCDDGNREDGDGCAADCLAPIL